MSYSTQGFHNWPRGQLKLHSFLIKVQFSILKSQRPKILNFFFEKERFFSSWDQNFRRHVRKSFWSVFTFCVFCRKRGIDPMVPRQITDEINCRTKTCRALMTFSNLTIVMAVQSSRINLALEKHIFDSVSTFYMSKDFYF